MTHTPKKTKAPWYVRAFNADYLARYKHRSDALAQVELPFVLQALNLPARAMVLDLCCGAGRHARGLANALKKNARIVGLDLSADMLKDAQSKNTAPQRLCFIRADMRRIPLATQSVDGVVNLFTSFGYFKTDREHLNVLMEVARVLKPGGRFVFDFFNREHVLANLVARSESQANGCGIVETRRYDMRSKRIVKTIRITEISRKGAKTQRNGTAEILQESIRAYGAGELKAMLIRAGFAPLSVHGDLSGGAFNAHESARCVWVCEKPKDPRLTLRPAHTSSATRAASLPGRRGKKD